MEGDEFVLLDGVVTLLLGDVEGSTAGAAARRER